MLTNPAVPMKNGIYSWVTEDDYHADSGSLSCSGAKLLLPPSCPAKFKYARENPPETKKVFTDGHRAHKLVLGKGAEIVEIDASDYRTKSAQEEKDKALANGKIPTLPHEMDQARAMARAVHQHPIAGKWFNPDHFTAEASVYTDDPVTGVRLRMRADGLWTGAPDGRLLCFDFKTSTTANPEELVRKFWQFGYFMQSAWYTWVLQLAKIGDGPAFVFIVTEKDPPHITTIVEYDADAMAEGARRNRAAIDLYHRCVQRDEWPAYADDIVSLSLPPYAFQKATMNDLFEENE